jgi:error-prone DNA polymerase
MRKDDGKSIMEARKTGGAFKSPEDLMRRAKLKPSAMLTLARADAFGSLDFGRRETLWTVAGLETNELPLFRPGDATERTGNIHNAKPFICNESGGLRSRLRDDHGIGLPPLKQEEVVAEDYAVFGLSLRNHPMAFMREEMCAKGMITAADLKKLANGKFVKIAGLVLFRQRPGTAKGTIFITMEDETGAANLIVWPKIAETYRRAVFGAKVILCEGILQKESNVIHVVSRRLSDWTPMLRRLQPEASAFGLRFGRGDEVAHASGGNARTSRANTSWTDTLKSRDFR